MQSHTIFIALGSNIGNRLEALREAANLMPPDIIPISFSKVYETPPWGYADQPSFLNQVIKAQTHLSPPALLTKLKGIEQELGRQPVFRYGPRLIDLDILFYDDLIYKSKKLTIPHPKIANRAFVLVPLMEIAPNFIHPANHRNIAEMAVQVKKAGIVEFQSDHAHVKKCSLDWGKRTYVMGIINITMDSFSGDGILQEQDSVHPALEKAKQFIAEGADILDIGAESSRPGSKPISATVELERLLPVLKALIKESIGGIISIDTYKTEVARQCLENGADWINDIWGFKNNSTLAEVISQYDAPVILMHNRSKPDAVKMNDRLGASYQGAAFFNFMEVIKNDLLKSVTMALSAGIREENIILDPGIGFGKTLEQNLMLINRLDEIKALGYPVLIGPSRKSFIGQILDLPIKERLEGTAASIAVGIARGADIIRVHDVKSMVRIAKVTDALTRRGTNY
ncbi:MAG: dihydropteroate synthase [Anaerolineaceae bacterium]|nr:dihydropteroate synthase [Anaerolineaceae bacterium]